MNAQELMSQANDAMHARRVFGEPYQKNGLTVIPVASIRGGWGGGAGGKAQNQEDLGWGGGGGLAARPVGAFVIKGDEVSWQPVIDVNRVILVGQMVAVVALLSLGATIRALSRRNR
jgi:uncharacterized spore protein YtfJ